MTKRKPRAADAPAKPEPLRTWPDGTRRSCGNAFTDHGYVIGSPIREVPLKRKVHVKAGIGANGGTYNTVKKAKA